MFKRIKEYFELQRAIQIEIIETLVTICMWLEYDGHYGRNPRSQQMGCHAKCLMGLSEQLRKR